MTRNSTRPKYGSQPSHRDLDHPLSQAMRLCRTWLLGGPATHSELERRAADRGINAGRLGEAVAALGQRGELALVEPGGRDRTYRLITTRNNDKEAVK